MGGSTFAGKSTADTIRNYAEMLIDDLNGNIPERAFEHWDKAREIDNKSAKRIFGEEYNEQIGKAYHNCVVKYQEPELIKLTGEFDEIAERMTANAGSGMGVISVYIEKLSEIDKEVTAKFDYIMSLINSCVSN